MIKPPLLTCEAVITESFFLLRNTYGGQEKILQLLERQAITIDFDLKNELIEIQRLLTIYKSVPVSLADACLVRMAELQSSSSVFTIDSDFQIYRKNRHEIIDIIIPNSL
jgi:predicted nucleic acid-binding protein